MRTLLSLTSTVPRCVASSLFVLALLAAAPVSAPANDLKAVPFVFVGRAGDCGTGYAAASNIVTTAWLGGIGLPDNGGPNVGPDPTDNPNKRNPHRGLLLSKNGTTPDCSAPGAEIKGVRGRTVTASFQLGFDYRNGGHCGAGAPRFNVVVRPPSGPETFHFVGGCSNDSTPTPAPQDPLQWTQVRFEVTSPTESFPPIPLGSRIRSITLVFDEGTDTPTGPRPSGDLGNPSGIGLTVVDNIFVGGQYIRRGDGIAQPRGRGDNDDDGGHDDD